VIAEIFGIHIGLICSILGGSFEVAVGIWLIIKGFQPEAYNPDQAVVGVARTFEHFYTVSSFILLGRDKSKASF
jgi:hypothetical protein